MKHNYFNLTIPALKENIGLVRIVVAAFAAQKDLTLPDLDDIKVAVSEAVTNSIVHGYGNNPGEIKVNGYFTEEGMYIEVIDFGKGIEREKIREKMVLDPEDEHPGLGFLFMQSLMDRVEIVPMERGTKVILFKRILKDNRTV
ncbi:MULTISPECIES: ATP-binding protein [Carboxydothermus]|uniref:Anti-sigma F factor n=2 Tax=Carboxydothermus TaxID=129957 RepID=Q3AAQ5_CARHZ|nr:MULTISPECIES: anti-sigma F factor [Carboxydothermus]ABB15368.1 anti-sigma F factor [Carboxydothermus hydrogenoformans Z-2901]NYE58673.1 stage II sporulation protein AB (anti-sigma F factor) [Carboxydothermus ferrireducens DSM 11255]